MTAKTTAKTTGMKRMPTHPQTRANAMTDVMNQYAEAERLAREGLYHPSEEHDACGVGLIAAIDGKPRREVVDAGIAALKAVWHRGAVDADGKTGDGAGLLLALPQSFFYEHIEATGHAVRSDESIAVGMVFLPRTDFDAQERARVLVEREILRAGFRVYGWRQVPTDPDCLGEKANAVRPEIEQIMVAVPLEMDKTLRERRLYLVRRRIENAARSEGLHGLYICSLSAESIVYKGMFLAQDLSRFYHDVLDPRFVSSFALYHQRYSTNTFPTWWLAQPFRVLAHNGEINTLRGNVNWMRAHETLLEHEGFGATIDDLKPVIPPSASDTAALDSVFELLTHAGRSAPKAKALLIPEAWSQNPRMPQAHKDFYAYCNAVMEPWDGPAALVAAQGDWVVAGMDRSGFRPLRYVISDDGLLIAGSEAGMVKLDEARITRKGRLGPGDMLAVNLAEGRFYDPAALLDHLAATQPYGAWVERVEHLDPVFQGLREPRLFDSAALRRRQRVYAQTLEDIELVLTPMVDEAKEPTGSMGDDTPTAVLSDSYRPLHHFFRQNFSQVTNPPLDSLREQRVMSLKTRLGNLGNILDEAADQCNVMQLESPVLSNAEFEALQARLSDKVGELDACFPVDGAAGSMAAALDRLRAQAEAFVREGRTNLVLSDMAQDATRAPLPMILATSAVHSHLVDCGLRTYTSLNLRSGECLDVHYVAVLLGVGATTLNPYLALEAIAERCSQGLFGQSLRLEAAVERYKTALNQGILKVMSKMGIGVLSSYRGGYNFEAIGLSRTLVDAYFAGVPSRISGIGLPGLEEKVLAAHRAAFDEESQPLAVGGFYRQRQGGEQHAWEAGIMHTLQTACTNGTYQTYRKFSDAITKQPPIFLRDLLDFRSSGRKALDSDDVESLTAIRKRFVTPGMSLGALSHEAHGTLNIAMNRIGAKSVSGEGGEDRQRYKPFANGDNANSAVKQVASGRFGVTAEYLNQAREIEIKMAQGAKPGEGGQLPGFKVSAQIAELRHSTPGVTLISPPPHHDIYSIEDLAQLIYDLKQINPFASVCVKLVARSGIGTIAAGVAKAKADVILIAGYAGGTGASPLTSIKHAGLPWELGLSEVHQVLTLNRLRHQVKLRTDGGLRTGRDIVMAAMLGAEEYGIGTASLIAMGCLMVRQCHSNTCPVGICTQDEELRKRFGGTAEKVVNLMNFLAEEVRELLAELGFASLNDIIGRTDLLAQVSRGAENLDDLDLNPLLTKADPGDSPVHFALKPGTRNEVPDTLDAQIIRDASALFERGEKMQLNYSVRNTQRTVGARLSSEITRRFGMTHLAPNHVSIRLRGSAGQSLGAWGVQGLRIEVRGDANDYVGKGLSGATLVVRPSSLSRLESQAHTIIGNTVLYGATAGELFAAGQAGERFCVRNSGAVAVVEGCGSNGCEYMTGGRAVILGPVGMNFAAGMTGGMAYVYDEEEALPELINPDSVVWMRIAVPHYERELHSLIQRHHEQSESQHAARLLTDWERTLQRTWQVVPKEMLSRLAVPVTPAEAAE